MKDIKGFEGLYAADESGKIWGYRQKKFLKTWLIGHGYQTVSLYRIPRKNEKFLVHRLIALTFIPNPNCLREVNHKDANRLNNKPENLEWVSSKQNKQHAIKLGLYDNLGKNTPKGSKNPRAKLNENIIKIIRKRKESSRKLAPEYGVSYHLIDMIRARKVWRHVV
jgi:hypothetical protein